MTHKNHFLIETLRKITFWQPWSSQMNFTLNHIPLATWIISTNFHLIQIHLSKQSICTFVFHIRNGSIHKKIGISKLNYKSVFRRNEDENRVSISAEKHVPNITISPASDKKAVWSEWKQAKSCSSWQQPIRIQVRSQCNLVYLDCIHMFIEFDAHVHCTWLVDKDTQKYNFFTCLN